MGGQKPLTAKQQGFTDSVLDGCSLSDSYRHNYNCANMSDRAIQVESSRLAAHPDVALMIAEKRLAVQEARLWTRQQALYEAETNLEMARASRQMGPANQALKIAVDLSGLTHPQTPGDANVTSITINLNRKDREPRAIEGSYRVLPCAAAFRRSGVACDSTVSRTPSKARRC